MLKKLLATMIIFCSLFTVVGCGMSQTDSERFYERRRSLVPAADTELRDLLLTAYKKAVEAEGIEVADHFISATIHNTSLDNLMIYYHVLTSDGEYFSYDVNTPSEGLMVYSLYDGRELSIADDIELFCRLIPENVYYVKDGEILLQQ